MTLLSLSHPQEFLSSLTFSRRIFTMNSWARSFVRVCSYVAVIILIGCIAALLMSGVMRLIWAGILLSLMLGDYLLHFRSAHYSVPQLLNGRVPHNNVGLCLRRPILRQMVAVMEHIEAEGGSLELLLMAALLDRGVFAETFRRLEISFVDFRQALEKEIAVSSTVAPSLSSAVLIEMLKRMSAYAALQAAQQDKKYIDLENIFSALAHTPLPPIRKIFDLFSITPDDLDGAIAFSAYATRRHVPLTLGGFAQGGKPVHTHRVNRTHTSRPTPVLDLFSRDITDEARAGEGGFLIGHHDVYDQLVTILTKPVHGNALLVGADGVGKKSVVFHLAYNIISDAVPGALFDRRLVELSLPDLLSGASGDVLSERLARVVNEITHAGNIILYIPHIHLLAKTVQESEGTSLADQLLPLMKEGVFPVIGSTYPKEFALYVESNSLFSGMFETIRVEEISSADACTLLSYDALVLEKKYHVTVYYTAIQRAVALAAKYLHAKPLPSSAEDLLQEAMMKATQQGEKAVRGTDVEAVVEQKVHVPMHRTSRQEADELLHLEDTIHQSFIDQDEAVGAVAQALRAYRSGLARTGGPIATFLFAGPTGVGKTELSKLLAIIHFGGEKFMVRFDMSEYQDKESIARFIGARDGAVAGALTETIMAQPYSLILLDEFEKAHPDLLNLFLQVFDDGRLTDSQGRVIDFKNTIIIATSNANSVFIQEQILAGNTSASFADEFKKRLTQYFKPELINRFSDIVIFKPLSPSDVEQIAALNVQALVRTLEDQGISTTITPAVVHLIAQKGYDPASGARPLRKAIDDYIKAPLSKKILEGTLDRGGSVTIDVTEAGDVTFV